MMQIDKISLIKKFNQGQLNIEELRHLEYLIVNNQIDIEELESYALFEETSKNEQFDLEDLDCNFYQMMNEQIDTYKAKERKFNWFKHLSTPLKYAIPVCILIVGIFIGNIWDIGILNKGTSSPFHMSENKAASIDQIFDNPSVSGRVQAMNLIDEDSNENKKINLLFFSLNSDDSNIVRLEAIDVLLKYSNRAEVRTRLINSIKEQQSPHVIQYLSEVLLAMRTEISIEKFRTLYNPNIPSEAIKQMEINLHTS